MGLAIYVADETMACPRSTVLKLTCDGDHGMLPAPAAEFRQDGYIAQHKAATKAGWKFASDGRIFGPCCPKKTRGDSK